MMNLNNFKLLKEDSGSYEIQHPNGKSLKVDKSGLNERAHALIKKLNPVHNYAEGEVVTPEPQQPVPMTSEPAQIAAPQTQVAPQALPVEQQLSIADKAYAAESAAEKAKGAAEAQGGQKTAAIIDQAMQNLGQMKTQNDIVDEYRQKDQALLDNYSNQKIDPDRYWKNQNTGAKLATGISLILGGMGAGLTHGRNMAQDLIENAISRDIDAQKNEQSKTANLFQMNRAALGDDTQANLATQNQMLIGLEYKLKQQAALTGSQVAKTNADLAIAQIQQKRDLNNQQLALIRSGMGAGAGGQAQDPSVLVPRLVPEPQQKAVFNEIERAQNTKRQYQGIMDSFDQAAVDVRPLSGGALKNVLPGVTSPYVKAFHAEMGPTFQNLEGTVRQAAMDNMDKNLTPQLGDSDETIGVKRRALQNYLNSATAAPTAKGYGIDISKFGSTSVPKPESGNNLVRAFMAKNPQVKSEDEAKAILKQHGYNP